ncbi:MAG: endoglucanase [Lachnospiraceae bacterium]|nr:endoglucanase [Lachnospiraceae bacterium]
MKQIPYVYKNAPIPGGGYVTGFLFDKTRPGVLFCRTDIGGTYRYEADKDCWKSLIDHVTMEKLDETYPIAITVNEEKPGAFYIICGVDRTDCGVLAVSRDYGESFTYRHVPTPVHGNWNGRGTGYRLVCLNDTLYFASQKGGLLISRDEGETWEQTSVCGEEYLTFVWVSPQKKGMLVAGTAGVTTGEKDGLRGTALYVSYDDGKTFAPMVQPDNVLLKESKWAGYVGERYDYDGKYLYITLAHTGQHSYVTEMGYSCDSGDTIGGKVLRYSFTEDGSIDRYEDITPYHTIYGGKEVQEPAGTNLMYGFSGISSTKACPGLLVCSTICKEDGDMVYRSFDHGTTWECILYDLSVGELAFRSSYMKPEHNGGRSLLHWLSDMKIDPHNKDVAWFNSGTGVFRTKNLTAEKVVFSDWCDGIEETVHLNVYSPNDGPVQVIDIVGDLGGFAFRDLTKPCRNSFDDKDGNRYITCINADYSEKTPECFVVTPRGNWKGKTKGGLILTKDAGATFERLPMPFGITEKIDELLHRIEQPNVNSGWVAMSPDCNNMVWTVADWIDLNADCAIVSNDGGQTFHQCKIFDKTGQSVDGSRGFKVFSDRVKNHLFYALGEASQLYISKDGGNTFCEKSMPEGFPEVDFHLIDCANKTEVRGDAGRSGRFYLALAKHGLWKLYYKEETDEVKAKRLTKDGEFVYRVGLGVRTPGGAYLGEDKAVYMCGVIEGEYGFYRSFDKAANWERINTKKQMFGEINSLDGDSRTFGRFYLATGSRGLVYGEQA